MINDRISQPTLVSGESGPGKAESTKSLMHYLAFMGGKPQAEGTSVQQQILESNPVIEAFGDAKLGIIILGLIFLERSRVCQISNPERNHHCLSMLCVAPPETENITTSIGRPTKSKENCIIIYEEEQLMAENYAKWAAIYMQVYASSSTISVPEGSKILN